VGAQEAVGAHRVAVGMVVAALLGAGAACIDSVVADSELLPRLLGLAFAYPVNNVLQSLCIRIVRCTQCNCPLLSPSLCVCRASLCLSISE
jgi:hypothetical protein